MIPQRMCFDYDSMAPLPQVKLTVHSSTWLLRVVFESQLLL